MHRRILHYHKHLQIIADCSPNLSSTSRSEADPSLRNAASTLALLDLLLAQTSPAAPRSDSTVRVQSETAELSLSPTGAADLAPGLGTSPLPPQPAQSAGVSADVAPQTSAQAPASTSEQMPASVPAEPQAGTSAQAPASTSAQTPEDIWAQAWQPLEAGQAASAQQAKHAQQAKTRSSAADANVKSTSLPPLRFWRQHQSSDDDGHPDKQQQKLRHNSGHHTVYCSCSCLTLNVPMRTRLPPFPPPPLPFLPPVSTSGSSRK